MTKWVQRGLMVTGAIALTAAALGWALLAAADRVPCDEGYADDDILSPAFSQA